MTSSGGDTGQTGLQAKGFPTPAKLKHDAIVEALCEIQFDHDEIPEVVIGKLASAAYLEGYKPSRQAVGALPIGLMATDPALRFQPTLQLDRSEPGEIIRIGPRVVSLHVLSPYPGWDAFGPRVELMTASLYDALRGPFISRIGLRYINALTPVHGFRSIEELTLDVKVQGARPSEQMLSGYMVDLGNNTKVQTKVATTDFVGGATVEGAVAYIDVDVHTPAPPGSVGPDDIKAWLINAHEQEKREFFKLWPDDKVEAAKA